MARAPHTRSNPVGRREVPSHLHGGDDDLAPSPALRALGRPGSAQALSALALQAKAGNAAVVSLIRTPRSSTVQRQPAPGAVHDVDPADADHVARDIQKDFYALYRGLMQANTLPSVTRFRHRLMLELDAIGMEAAVDRGVFTEPHKHMDELAIMSEKLSEVREKLAAQNRHATQLLTWFDGQFRAAKAELSLGAATEQHALAILTQSYDQAAQRMKVLGAYAVAEDFVHVVEMLKQKTHLAAGAAQAEREEKQLAATSAEVAAELAEGDDGPGFFSTVWSVVGWDSVGDFVSDLALTAVTFGASKYARGAKRGKKALDAAKAAKGARKLKYLRRMEKLDKVKDTAERMVRAVADHQAEISNLLKWARANAPGLTQDHHRPGL